MNEQRYLMDVDINIAQEQNDEGEQIFRAYTESDDGKVEVTGITIDFKERPRIEIVHTEPVLGHGTPEFERTVPGELHQQQSVQLNEETWLVLDIVYDDEDGNKQRWDPDSDIPRDSDRITEVVYIAREPRLLDSKGNTMRGDLEIYLPIDMKFYREDGLLFFKTNYVHEGKFKRTKGSGSVNERTSVTTGQQHQLLQQGEEGANMVAVSNEVMDSGFITRTHDDKVVREVMDIQVTTGLNFQVIV